MVSNTTKGVFAIIGCLFVDVSVGEYNLLSFLYPYFGSYFHYKDRSITVDNTPIIGAVWLLCQIFSGLFGVVLNGYLGYRLTFFFFIVIFCAGQFAASYVTNFYAFIFCYAIPGGTAQGALMVLPLYCAWRYFPASKKPLISGIILSAYALAPILSSFVSHRLINPENIDVVEVDGTKVFPQEIADRTPNFIRVFTAVCFVLGTFGVLLIVEPNPEPYQPVPDEYRSIRKIPVTRKQHDQFPRAAGNPRAGPRRPQEAGDEHKEGDAGRREGDDQGPDILAHLLQHPRRPHVRPLRQLLLQKNRPEPPAQG
jgi:MFS family permease